MLASNEFGWFARRRPPSPWPSFVVAAIVTTALFAVAVVSMRSVSIESDRAPSERERPLMVHFDPPRARVAAPPPPHTPSATTRAATSASAAPIAPPIAQPLPTTPAAPTIAAPTIAAPTVATPARDSSRGVPSSTTPIPLGILPPPSNAGGIPTGARSGAPIAPAGVTVARPANTAAFRDSVAHVRMLAIPELSRTRAASAETRAEVESSRRAADALRRRTTTAGNSRDVAAPSGEGKDGVGAVGGGGNGVSLGGTNGLGVQGSIAFPLFSSGPSPAERARAAKLDADYQARLRRLDDLVLLRRDSIRADSLRRDSIAAMRQARPRRP